MLEVLWEKERGRRFSWLVRRGDLAVGRYLFVQNEVLV